MDKISGEESIVVHEKPQPQDFDIFLPWACAELRLDIHIVIESTTVEKPIQLKSAKSRMKAKNSFVNPIDMIMASDHDSMRSIGNFSMSSIGKKVRISATHDPYGNLLQLKFLKNKNIPCQLLKIIELILPYHKQLTSITINQGIDSQALNELCKLVNFGTITDVCLDDTSVINGCYDLLLENRHKLRHLSLARCKIEDEITNRLALHLAHPLPASYTLQTLNLASNYITDVGAKQLAVTLRSNRHLVYLNLSDNAITDDGSVPIFDALTLFLVTNEEIMSYRARKVQYIKEREFLTRQIVQELKLTDVDKKYTKKKTLGKKAKDDRELSITDLEMIWYDKAKNIAEERMGEFSEPFTPDKIFMENDLIYCYGNNTMAYINISYNHIGYVTVKKIVSVLLKQQSLKRKPMGLANVNIEGNNIPKSCLELSQIDAILLSNIPSNPRKMSLFRPKK